MKENQQKDSKYKIWSYHYDFSEINKRNYHEIFKSYFSLTTKKITLLAMILVINVIFTVISKFVLGNARIGGFLTFNITIWTVVIVFMAMGFIYALLFLELTIWFRMLLGDDVVQTLSININDLTFLILFAVSIFIINYIRVNLFKVNQERKRLYYFLSIILAFLIAGLITSGLDVIYNKYFLIDMYFSNGGNGAEEYKKNWVFVTIFWFNIVQTIINLVIFSMIFKVTYLLIDRYVR